MQAKLQELVGGDPEGVSLLLAERVDGSHALILADRPESFVAVNILGTEDPLSREDLEAFAEGIDENGALLVRRVDGAVSAVQAGEVSVRGLYGYTT